MTVSAPPAPPFIQGPTIAEAFAPTQTRLPTPVLTNKVPGDINTLNIQPTSLAAAYGNAGLDRAALVKGIQNNIKLEAESKKKQELVLKQRDDSEWLKSTIDAGMMEARSTISEYRKLSQIPDLGYVTAAQANLYIGGILVDECYDVQYQYKEYKEPVYGYNDKHWSAVLKGNVIVSGTFTINYKHDAYLVKLLDKLANEDKGKDDVAEAWKRKEAFNNKAIGYKAELGNYKAQFKKLNDLKKSIKDNKAQLEALELMKNSSLKAPSLIEADFKMKNDNLDKKKTDFIATLSIADKEKVLQDESNFVTATANYQASKAVINDQNNEQNAKLLVINAGLKTKTARVREIETILQTLKRDAILEQELLTVLGEIAELNVQKAAAIAALKDIEVQSSEYLQDETNRVEDTLNDNSKQYVTMALQKEKLKAEEQEAYDGSVQDQEDIGLDIEELEAKNKGQEAALTELNKGLAKSLESLQDMKGTLNELNDFVVSAAKSATYADTSYTKARAEDYGTWQGEKFAIFLEYNGTVHKVLEECTLTGHGHVVAQGGEVIKEYYTFICKKIR